MYLWLIESRGRASGRPTGGRSPVFFGGGFVRKCTMKAGERRGPDDQQAQGIDVMGHITDADAQKVWDDTMREVG